MTTVPRLLLAATAATLALAPSAGAVDTAMQDLFVARDACGGADPANIRLSAAGGAFSSGCGSLLAGTGVTDTVFTTPKGDPGLPVVLDPTRPATAAVAVSSFLGAGVGGIGEETVRFTLTGKLGTKTVTLGSATASTPADKMLTQASNTYEFELPLDKVPAGTYTSITWTLGVGGSQLSSYVDYGGGTFVSLPVTDASVENR